MFVPSTQDTPPDLGLDLRSREVVLLVEDNDFIAGLVTCLLERRGRRVLRARNGADCQRRFAERAEEIGLAIVDCRLSDMDGLALCRSLRGQRRGLPVLLTSGQNYAGPRSLANGPTAFLAKPFLPAELQRQVEALTAAIA